MKINPNPQITLTEKITNGVKKAVGEIVEFQNVSKERIVFIPCDKLIIENNQPFRLYTDEQLTDLAARIKQIGLLNPIIVRPSKNENGKYEILSGRNRTKAVMMNGDKEIEALIRNVEDDEAAMIMLNANLGQRENLLPSEKAKAYKMESEILNRNGKRPESTFSNNWKSFDARKIIAEKHAESKASVSNYIQLAHLIPELLMLVDEKKLPILSGVEISYLIDREQKFLLERYLNKGVKPSIGQLTELKKLSKAKNLNNITIANVLAKKEKSSSFIKLYKKKFSQYSEIIENESKLEQLFLAFLESYKQDGK